MVRQASGASNQEGQKAEMDYCSSCRRHLNGALVCPGCGAYAPDIAPTAVGSRIGSDRSVPSAGPDAPAHAHDAIAAAWTGGPLDVDVEYGSATDTAPHAIPDVEQVPPARQGRAARRRQLAQWRKNKRRAAVASAFALVGGGLTIAAMDGHSTDRVQAATAPENPNRGAEQKKEYEEDARTAPVTAEHPHQSATAVPSARPLISNEPREQSLPAPTRTTSPVVRPEPSEPARHPVESVAPQAQSTTPAAAATAPERAGTTERQRQAPSADEDAEPDTSQPTSPSRTSTSPVEVCLLGLCVG
ncbi:hypothetical protein ACFW9D_22740 [Streptomyces sp. NPDC059524]|uniref:SCO2400 family protein n=1 Tax=Streptomyces sp. NPDC059524 TaxID=3346856 RepID=UPI0036A43BEF